MKINQVLVEATGATVAFAFGRFNPAHQGHIEVWRAVEEAGANWFIGTNPNTIGPNDPLTFQQKSAWMEEIYPPISGHIVPQTSVLTLAAYIFKKLRNNESATIAYVTDDTDWAWSGKLLNQYNGVEGAHGYYKFAQITHVPSPRVSSATALRDAARADDKVAFYHASGTDPKLKVAGLSYFDTVKQACEKYPLPVKKAKKVNEQAVSEANPNQQFALWHPETKTYKGTKNKIPTSDYAGDNDITTNYRKVDNFKHSEVNPLHKGDDSIEKAERNVNREQLAKLVKAAFNILTPEEKEVLNYRFWHDMTLDSIAQKMSISGPRVRQIEAQAFRKLKKSSNLTPVGENIEQHTELSESTSLQTTIKAIINDTGEPVTATYETLKFLAKKYIKDNGEFDRGWRMVAMGPGASWVERFYATKLKNELYDLLVYNKKDTADLREFLWGEYKDDDQLEMKRSFSNISQALPPILAELGVKLNAPQMTKNANRWMQNLKQYQDLLTQLQQDSATDTTQSNNSPVTPKSTLPGQQNAQVEKIVNDILAKLPKNVSGEIRNIVSRSSNKIQALQKELTDRNLSVKESTEQKTVAKTWDQMTPQEKISGVKGRTVWNEKTQRYYTVFDVPVKQTTDEASLATMRDYFAGDEKAHDPYEITKQRLHFSKDKNLKSTVDKRFRSPEEYQAWLKQNKLKQISSVKEDEEAGEVKKTGQLIPFPAGTTKVHVSDVYDWYKLGMVISDLDDADPKTFGQGAPQTIIAFGSEEEESKLMPLLKRLGLRIDDIDPEGADIDEAYHAGSLNEMLTKRKQ